MPQFMRKRTILAKIEGTYGTDPNPLGNANAILIRNLSITPQATDLASRDVVRPYLGNSESLPVAVHAEIEFEIELAGSGTAGTAPLWGPLMRACGFAEVNLGSAQTGTAQAGSATTLTLAAGASATDDAYKGMTLRTTGGTGSGQSRVIGSYVGSTKVATVTEAWTVTPNATTTYSVDAQSVYLPVSSAFESVTMYFNIDGVLHKMLGARGSVAFELNAKSIPVMKFKFMGLYVAVADAAAPSVVLSGWQKPLPVNNVNTPALSIHGLTTATMSQFSLDMNVATTFRTLVGGTESVLLTDRKPSGQITIEGVPVATKDWWTTVKNATTAAFSVTHGLNAGNIVKIDAPALQLTQPQYQDLDGVAMLQMGMIPVPGVNGNDEITISVK